MTLTIEFGFWLVPTALTLLALIHTTLRRPTDMWDIGGALILFGWICAVLTAWIMWGLTWLM